MIPTMPRRVSHPTHVSLFTRLARLLTRIRHLHTEHDGVVGSPRVWEELRYAASGVAVIVWRG
jgi:hypothetical protein